MRIRNGEDVFDSSWQLEFAEDVGGRTFLMVPNDDYSETTAYETGSPPTMTVAHEQERILGVACHNPSSTAARSLAAVPRE